MGAAGRRPHRLRFATFEVDAGSRELFKQGRKVKLQEQPFELLLALLERPGEVLTREELEQRIWPDDTVVDFDRGINRAINRVRDALGDSAENPRFVETLPRRGYRFIAPVQELDLADAELAPSGEGEGATREPPAGPTSGARAFAGKRVLLAAAGAMALAAALFWNPGNWRDRLTGASPGYQVRSIAVLPFANLSNDPAQEYFTDGITDELITDLASLDGVRVISRTSVMSYKGKRQPLPAIASALGVDAVVEGSVVRANQRVRITAQLLLAREDRHLWAASFERDLGDILSVQRDIAAAIARQIRAHVLSVAGSRRTAIAPAAYDDYLQGRFFWNRRSVPDTLTAIRYFERAIGIDPNAAVAWAGLADCYNTQAAEQGAPNRDELFSKATAAAVRALEIDPDLGEAHASLGYTYLFHTWDWAGAKRELDRAVELNPNDASAHDWLSHYSDRISRKPTLHSDTPTFFTPGTGPAQSASSIGLSNSIPMTPAPTTGCRTIPPPCGSLMLLWLTARPPWKSTLLTPCGGPIWYGTCSFRAGTMTSSARASGFSRMPQPSPVFSLFSG